MTDKERLESIKEDVEIGVKVWGISVESIDWLVEQAELTEALKNKYLALRNIHNITLKTGDLVAEENKRYKQAMQNAINACRYTNPEVAYILSEALEGEE